MIIILMLLGALAYLYLFVFRPMYYWSDRNVKTGKVIPLFGDNLFIISGRESFAGMIQRIYNQLTDVRYIGAYQFRIPVLLIKSPDLIQQLCTKEFHHFEDHRVVIPDGVDEIWSKNLISLRGQTWKNMRCIITPMFTGSKLKAMYNLIGVNANIFVEHFLNMNKQTIELDFKEAVMRYTNDVIASIAFGIEIDSLEDEENQFYIMGRMATNFNRFWTKFVFFIYQMIPAIAAFFRIILFKKKVKSFFLTLVKDSMKLRQEQKIDRPDLLGLLLDARKEQQKKQEVEGVKNITEALSDMNITAQLLTFLIGGFESVSTVLCFAAYELATNPDVQQKLIEEIDSSESSYENVMRMTYLDMFISEVLRRWPIAAVSDRIVTKPYTIEPLLPDEKPLHLDVGTIILVPIYPIHLDPKYYENPEKFDPERFSEENRKNIDPRTYLPFGVGPRKCVASRFALLQVKSIVFHLLSHFEIVPFEKTQIPLRLSKTAINLSSETGFHFALKRRN